MSKLLQIFTQVDLLLARFEKLLPPAPEEPSWDKAMAFKWQTTNQRPGVQPIKNPNILRLNDIHCVNRQKLEIDRNTRQFIRGFPANNSLLWGSRGTGKSSLIKALLNEYASEGLRQIQVDKDQLVDLPLIIEYLEPYKEKFILFCDDLSFEANDPGYKALKAALDGSLHGLPNNVIIYATSNRRHLLPEFHKENQESTAIGGEIHFAETVEEKISLSDRFGLWLSFHPFTQDQYLEVVRYWLEELDTPLEPWNVIREESLKWALNRGSRSGRTAWQFCKDWGGRLKIQEK